MHLLVSGAGPAVAVRTSQGSSVLKGTASEGKNKVCLK